MTGHVESSSSLDDLLFEFGMELHIRSSDTSIRPPPRDELKEKARRWIEERNDEIRRVLNTDPEIRKAAYGGKARSKQVLGAMIADALAVPLTGGVPFITLGLLIAHHYLDFVIEDEEENEDDE